MRVRARGGPLGRHGPQHARALLPPQRHARRVGRRLRVRLRAPTPQHRVPQAPLLRLRPRLRPRQAAAVRHEAVPPHQRPQAHHLGGVRHDPPIPRRPFPPPRRRRRVRQAPRRGRHPRPRDAPRLRPRPPRGWRHRRLPRPPRRTHRRRVPPHARRTRVPSRRDGDPRRSNRRRRREMARGTRRRAGRLGGDARRDGHRRPGNARGERRHGPATPGRLVAGPQGPLRRRRRGRG